jgi:hypothetical protein
LTEAETNKRTNKQTNTVVASYRQLNTEVFCNSRDCAVEALSLGIQEMETQWLRWKHSGSDAARVNQFYD